MGLWLSVQLDCFIYKWMEAWLKGQGSMMLGVWKDGTQSEYKY
jgi:hypothetical protein